MEKYLYSIGEVAQMLGESTSLVRYWSDRFEKFIHPRRNGNGNRQYRKEDIDVLKQIHFMVNNDGVTLEGVEWRLDHEKGELERRMKVISSLEEIRDQLVEVSKGMKL